MITAALLIAVCSWNHPGADAYRGDARAAIEAKTQIPATVRAKLIERAEKSDFDDVVYIDRDTIRSTRYDYDPGISDMAFGARGVRCADVDRSGWTPDRVESAMVFCEGSWCVARPSVCNNWALISRRERSTPVGSARPLIAEAVPSAPAGSDSPVVGEYVGLPVSGVSGIQGIAVTYGSVAYEFGGCDCLPPPPVCPPVIPSIPEPSAYAFILLGLGVVAVKASRAQR